MLDQTRTRVERTFERAVFSGDTVLEAGLALTSVIENGQQKLRRSNAVNNSIFQGISWGNYLGASTTTPLTNTYTAGAAVLNGRSDAGVAAVSLPYPATSAADMLVIAGANYGAASGMTNVSNANNAAAVTDATKYALSSDGLTVYVYGSLANTQVFIAYRWTPTANQLRLTYGDQYLPTGAAMLNRIGCIVRGSVFTSAYDTSIDWSVASDYQAQNVVRAGANGRFTLNSNGAICTGVVVLSVPSISDPFLGLEVRI